MEQSGVKDYPLSFTTLTECKNKLSKLFIDNPQAKYRLTLTKWTKKRSISANKVYQAWIPAISDELALTIPEATRYIKLTFGLPILLADDYMGRLIGEGLNAKGFFQLSYEQRLIEMERLPVTRLFDTKMHNRLRDDLQHHFGLLGLDLGYKD